MSSFYGMGGGSSSGSNLSNDYNKVQNVPITNVGTKTEGNFIVLSGLAEKHYNLIGYYKVDSDDDVHYTDSAIDLLVYKDAVTGYKVVQYFTTENGDVYLNTHVYDGATKVSEEKNNLSDKTPLWETM